MRRGQAASTPAPRFPDPGVQRAIRAKETAVRTAGTRLDRLTEQIRRDAAAFTLLNVLRVLLADDELQQAIDFEQQARKHAGVDEQAADRLRESLVGYLRALDAGGNPELPADLRGRFDPAFLRSQLDHHLAAVKEANAHRRPGAGKRRVRADYAEVAAAIVRWWVNEQARHDWTPTVWSWAVDLLVGRCRVPGIDEGFVREWVARASGFTESDPRAAELHRLAADGEQHRLLDELRAELPAELRAKVVGWFGVRPGATTADPAAPSDRPTWDAKTRTLRVGRREVKRYRRAAANQIALLDKFQAAGWPKRVGNPLNHQSLSVTVRDLNNSLGPDAPVRFRMDGTGDAAEWEFTSPELS